ncbi:hypothetical protein ACFQV4_30555 [Streptomyces thermocarboxydus]
MDRHEPSAGGRAMGLLDEGVPWWRVVHADGTPATCHQGQRPGCWPRRGHRCGDTSGHATRTASRADACPAIAVITAPYGAPRQ